LQTIGTAGITAGSLWISEDGFWAVVTLVCSFGLWGWGQFNAWKEAPRVQQLRRDNDRLRGELRDWHRDYFEACSEQLATLANDILHLDDTERITVYKHTGSAFVILGRYSKNPEFAKRGRRGIYPDDEGCIGEAWRNGASFVDDLPDPSTEQDAYTRRLEGDWKIPPATSRGFRMKSRCLAGLALEDPKGTRRTAVIVFESTLIGRFDMSVLRGTLASEEGSHIVRFLEQRKAQEPSPDYAAEEGF
jgi:hypothetical protein